jgi:hypothetical protein
MEACVFQRAIQILVSIDYAATLDCNMGMLRNMAWLECSKDFLLMKIRLVSMQKPQILR